MSTDNSGPAFPVSIESPIGHTDEEWRQLCTGMTLRQYAAIKLRVPYSGLDWLDDMISDACHQDMVRAALQGIIASGAPDKMMENLKQVEDIDVEAALLGSVADILNRKGHPKNRYLGIDFSREAIKQARIRVPGFEFSFGVLPDVVGSVPIKVGWIVVFCEVLEHFRRDLDAIEMVESRVRILASVPTFNSKGHVRWFGTRGEVLNRYGSMVNVKTLVRIKSHYLFDGVRR